MQHEAKKISMIVDELVTLLLNSSQGRIDTAIIREENLTRICITQSPVSYSEDFIIRLQCDLNTNRQHEIEGYYWQLIGDDDDGDEVALVGAMVDEAIVTYEDKELKIDLVRR
jgi:hypothetical protein